MRKPRCEQFSCNLEHYLKAHGKCALYDIDTRALVRRLRTKGAMAGTIVVAKDGHLTQEELQSAINQARSWGSMVGRDLASEVTTDAPYEWTEGLWTMTGNEGTVYFYQTAREIPSLAPMRLKPLAFSLRRKSPFSAFA